MPMITTEKFLFARKKKINDKYSQGCNLLIAQNKARILQNFEEILDELQLGKEKERWEAFLQEK